MLRGSLFFALWLAASVAAAQDYKVGDKVVVIKRTKLTAENAAGANVLPGMKLTVGKVDGSLLWAGKDHPGWLKESDVVPFEHAISYFTAALKANPVDPDCRYARGWLYADRGSLDAAIADFNELIQLRPRAAAYYARGSAWRDKHECDKAIADFNEAIRLDPRNAASYDNRGNSWCEKGEYDKAIADFNEALRLNPSRAITYSNRGAVWRKKGEPDKAIADYNESLRLDPTNSYAYSNRGWAWETKGGYEKAIADYNAALRLDPTIAAAYNNAAWLRATCLDQRLRDGKVALDLAAKACELTAWKDSRCLGTLAAAYAEAGQFDKAVEWQTKARDISPAAEKADSQTRLDLYKAGKPYREQPQKK